MFRGMLRDDGNRMASVRRDDKVKVKRRDKLGKVSDAPRPGGLGKQYIEMRGGAKRGRGMGESNREMDVVVTRNISRENRRAREILPSGSNNAGEDYGVRCGNGGESGERERAARLGCR